MKHWRDGWRCEGCKDAHTHCPHTFVTEAGYYKMYCDNCFYDYQKIHGKQDELCSQLAQSSSPAS